MGTARPSNSPKQGQDPKKYWETTCSRILTWNALSRKVVTEIFRELGKRLANDRYTLGGTLPLPSNNSKWIFVEISYVFWWSQLLEALQGTQYIHSLFVLLDTCQLPTACQSLSMLPPASTLLGHAFPTSPERNTAGKMNLDDLC